MTAVRVVFLGPPGAGKGTQAERFAAAARVAHLSTGEMLRRAASEGSALGLRVKPVIEAGKLVPDDLMWSVVSDRIDQADCAGGFLLDGFPRTVPQATLLDARLTSQGRPLTHVVDIDVNDDELVRRLLGRGRKDDTPEVIRERLRVYSSQTEPLKGWYRSRGLLRSIDGRGTPDEVFARVLSATGVGAG